MKLKTSECRDLFTHLLSLNGAKFIYSADGQEDEIVEEPYKFSGGVTYTIAKNLRLLKGVIDDFEAARVKIIKAVSGGTKIDAEDVEQLAKFQAEIGEVLATEVDLAGFLKIKLSGLNLDSNAIPPGLITALLPYIDEAL